MASIRRERGEAGRAAQAFRDLVVLLFLLLLVFSVRFSNDEGQPAVEPLPGGVQAAGHDRAEPLDAAPATVPALATPDPTASREAQPVARLREVRRSVETKSRVLIYHDGEVHEIRLPARLSLTSPRTKSCEQHVDVLARS